MGHVFEKIWFAVVCYLVFCLFNKGFRISFQYIADVLRGLGQYLPKSAAGALEGFAQGLEESARMFSLFFSPSRWEDLSLAYRRGGWPAVRQVWEKDERK